MKKKRRKKRQKANYQSTTEMFGYITANDKTRNNKKKDKIEEVSM